MLHLELLGRVGLREETGRDVDDLLRQSKRLALLAYLALPAPGTWHRRDTLLALFWPEADETRARTALRNALYVIRQALGEGVVRNRGDDEVSLDPALISCDAARFGAALADGRDQDAVALYHGEFLPGFFVSGSDGFEAWAEEQRRDLRTRARAAAVRVSEARASAGDMAGAIDLAHRALAIEPTEETVLRHLVSLLDATGDRAGALAAYDRFRLRVRAELEADPAPETEALVERVRQRIPKPALTPPRREGTAASASPAPVLPDEVRVSAPPAVPRRPGRRALLLLGVAAVVLAGYGVITRVGAPGASTPAPPSIVVLPVENASGEPGLDYLALGVADGVVAQLRSTPGLSVISAITADWTTRPGQDPVAEARKLKGTLVQRSRLERVGDSLQVVARLIETATGRQVWVQPIPLQPARIRDAEGQIVAGIVGAAVGRYSPSRPTSPPVDPESWRLTLQGRYYLLSVGAEQARIAFQEATERDPTNAAAWSGLSSAWASLSLTGRVREAEGWPRADYAARRALALDSTQAPALANLGGIRAIRDGDVTGGEAMIRRAIALDPTDGELQGAILATVLRLDGRRSEALDAVRIAQQVEPLSPFAIDREGFLLLCDGRPAEALARYRDALRLHDRFALSHHGVARSLAALGRWDEALAAWRSAVAVEPDTALARLLSTASGESGYWRVQRFLGARTVRRLSSLPGGPPSPGRLGMAWLQAGDIDRGVALIQEDIQSGGVQVYHLGCHESADESRNDPRVRALLTAYGRLGSVNRPAGTPVRTDTAK